MDPRKERRARLNRHPRPPGQEERARRRQHQRSGERQIPRRSATRCPTETAWCIGGQPVHRVTA
eukprot:2497748-Pyramimonas_sp.AAC.1